MNETDDLLIRDYADGSLSGHALREFEKRLKDEPELASELDLYLALKASDNQRQKRKLSMATGDDLSPQKPSGSRHLLFWLSIVTILVLGAIAAWKMTKGQKKEDIQKMAQTFSSPYPPPVATMGAGDTMALAVQQAYMAYRTGDFAAAAQQLSALAAQSNATDEMLFYTGESFLQTGQWARAIEYFDQVQPGYYREIADWRCALALIQQRDNGRARQLLEALLNTSRRAQAEKLLKAMK